MAKKDREGLSKRQEFREKRRRSALRNRLISIGVIVLGALLVAFFLIYPQLKPVTGIQAVTPEPRPSVNRNTTGDPNAPVKLTEFSDYQCPYCRDFWKDTEGQIINSYVASGKVQFIARSAGNWVSGNIGGGGVESQDSAMAAYCAADQNRFWDMYDALFGNVLGEEAGSFTPRRLQAIAQNIGLDMNAFNSCYSNNKYANDVNQDFLDAKAAGITGTPFFLISYTAGGQPKTDTVDGAQPFSAFQQKLDAALAAAGAK
jgi:protein-disulfide isomerase